MEPTTTKENAQKIEVLERSLVEVKSDLQDIRLSLVTVVDRHTTLLTSLGEKLSTAIEIQSNSLSIPLLKDVLVPMIMRLFVFFTSIVLFLLSAILGIKWAASDLLNVINK